MEEVNLRFQHISEQIFGCLDNESLANCQEVCRSWNNFLDGQKFLHARVILESVRKYHEVGKSWFQVFNKCKTKTIVDLRIAVEHLYQGLVIFASYTGTFHFVYYYKYLSTVKKPKILQCVSPLLVAAAFGQLTLFDDILQKVESKFPIDGFGRSTLHYAAMNDHLNIYESIVTINGNILPRSTDILPTTLLDMAVVNNSINVCRYIVENNQDPISYPDTNSGVRESTPLHMAALKGHIEIYKILTEKVVDKNPFYRGWTPLHFAALNGHLELCRLILENVNDKNPSGVDGKTLEDMARDMIECYNQSKHFEIVKLFSQKKGPIF